MLTRDTRADATSSFSDAPPSVIASCPLARKGRWVVIELVDEIDQPVAGERYVLKAKDGTVIAEGATDSSGVARVDGLTDESCVLSFPSLDAKVWEKIGA